LEPVIDIKSFKQMVHLALVRYDNFKTNFFF